MSRPEIKPMTSLSSDGHSSEWATGASSSFFYASAYYMSLVMRKPVFGVFDQVWLKPACSAKEARQRHEIANIETRDIKLSRQRTTKVLIRLWGCIGRSVTLLFAYGINRFSHDAAHMFHSNLERVRDDWTYPFHNTDVSSIIKSHLTHHPVFIILVSYIPLLSLKSKSCPLHNHF